MPAQTTEGRDPAELRSAPDPTLLEARGLTSVQVSERLRLQLANVQPRTTSRTITEILRTHLLTTFNIIIGVCALMIIILGQWLDLLFAIAAVGNVIIGLVQEYGAKRKLDAIALLHQDHIRVLRDGLILQIHREQVVLDDVVELRRGDQVPADGTVLSASDLDIDESMLTGESAPVTKRRGDQVLSGTAVLSGSGRFMVTAVGEKAHAVRLMAEAKKYRKINSEIRRSLERIAFWLSIVLVPIAAVVVNGQMQAHGGWSAAWESGEWREAMVTAVSSMTAMIPQGLALMTTIAFAVAAVKLARQHVLIQEQPAVEILARVDVVCFDKTGTLTDGSVVFLGAAPIGERGTVGPWQRDPASMPAQGSSLSGTDPWQQVLAHFGADEQANPTAAALTVPFTALPRHRPVSEVPFASARRWSAVEFASDAGELSGHWVLGAPEILRTSAAAPQGSAETVLAHTDEYSAQGLRTMVLCWAPPQPSPRGAAASSAGEGASDEANTAVLPRGAGTPGSSALSESSALAQDSARSGNSADPAHLPAGLTAVAILTFRERVRQDAAPTLQYLKDQGVEITIISGDHPKTVAAAARDVGLEFEGDGVDASVLGSSAEELRSAMASQRVFGRVAPEQKAAMVQALQANGHVVAMTGDGINDAMAVKNADLGIAMGAGAPATKAVSRMVLLDGKFSRLPSVLEEGRKVIANTERLAHLFLTKTGYAVLLGLFFALAFWSFPFLPRQFSTVDFLMIGFPAFFLALMPNTQRYRPGFLRRSALFSIPAMLSICVCMVAVSAFGRHFSSTATEIQTASFICLALMGIWVLNTALRPLTMGRMALVAAMYVALAAVLLVPISAQYHVFLLPNAELLAATFVSALVGCGLIELGHRLYVHLVDRPAAGSPARS